jgi:hypothetical protein
MLELLALLWILSCFGGAQAEEPLALRAFSFQEGFEGETDPVSFWSTNGKYVVNFKGLTTERAFSGRKSLKLDVTITEGSYCFWQIPLRAPAEGKLKCAARVLAEQADTFNRFGLGVNCIILPPFPNYTTTSRMFPTYEKTDGQWKLLEVDVVRTGRAMLEQFLPTLVWGASAENVAVLANNVCFYLTSKRQPGTEGRIVVYIDDISVSGEVPGEAEFLREGEKRWAPAKERSIAQIAAWEKRAADAERELAALTNLPAEAAKIKEQLVARLAGTKRAIEDAKRDGRIAPAAREQIDPFVRQLPVFLSNIRILAGK